jgi:hypothetical protein
MSLCRQVITVSVGHLHTGVVAAVVSSSARGHEEKWNWKRREAPLKQHIKGSGKDVRRSLSGVREEEESSFGNWVVLSCVDWHWRNIFGETPKDHLEGRCMSAGSIVVPEHPGSDPGFI